jgi:hypothetical protein
MHAVSVVRRVLCSIAIGAVGAISFLQVPSSSAATVGSSEHASTLAQGSRILPPSASTCSGNVCEYVTGSGLNVSNWSTTAFISRSMCSTPHFLVNGSIRKTGVLTCGPANTDLGSDWSNPGNFPNGTVICNTWSGISGEPCVTVHS